MILVTIPFPPTLNSLYPDSGGRRVLSKAGKDFKDRAIWACRQQIRYSDPLVGRISCEIRLFPPDNRRFDIGNREKAVCDAMTEARIWLDDSQIDRLLIERKGIDPDGDGYAEVEIVEIESKAGT